MKHILLTILAAVLSISLCYAQPKKMEDTDSFVKRLEKASSSIKSIECDFKQVKRLEIYDEDVTSSGQFYYKADDKICLKYVKPYPYQIVINGSKLSMESGGKKNTTDLKDNKLMSEMQGVLTTCMTGNFANISASYKMDFFDDTDHYLILIKPTSKALQAHINKFEIYLNKKDLSVDKLRISETEKDYTEYSYANKKFNKLANDPLFASM